MEIMTMEPSVLTAETWSNMRNAHIAQLIHKLKSPVTAITIYVELLHRLEGSAVTEQALLYLDKLRGANGEVKRIVGQLLQLFQAQSAGSSQAVQLGDSFDHPALGLHERQLIRKTYLKVAQETRLAPISVNLDLRAELLAIISADIRASTKTIEEIIHNLHNRSELDASSREALDQVDRNCRHILDSAQDLFEFFRVETASAPSANLAPIALAKLMEHWEMRLRTWSEQNGLTFRIQVDPQLPEMLYGDERAIDAIVIELIGQAFRSTKSGCVAVTVSGDDRRWSIQIGDDNAELPEGEFNSDTEETEPTTIQRRNDDPDLQLGTARQLTQLLGGEMTVNVSGQGSVFRLTLPTHKSNLRC